MLAKLPYILSPFADLVVCVVICFTLGDRELFTSRVLMIDWVLTVFIKSDTIWKYRNALSAPAGAVSQAQEGLFWSTETEINSNLNRVTRVCAFLCVYTSQESCQYIVSALIIFEPTSIKYRLTRLSVYMILLVLINLFLMTSSNENQSSTFFYLESFYNDIIWH